MVNAGSVYMLSLVMKLCDINICWILAMRSGLGPDSVVKRGTVAAGLA